MANNTVVAAATGSYIVDIDSDNDSTAQSFKVTRDGTGGQTLLEVKETGEIVASLGKGDFSAAGVRTKQVASIPSNNVGQDGDIQVLSDGTDRKLLAKIAGVWCALNIDTPCW